MDVRTSVAAVTCLLLVGPLAACSAGVADSSERPDGRGAEAGPSATTSPRPAVTASRAPSVVEPEAPAAATLPSGARVAVRAVSTAADGELDVPADVRRAGWWDGGSRLGDPFGAMLVAGHVDSRTQGLGPFAELLQVRPGDRVDVGSRHLRQAFTVRSLRLVDQGPLRSRASLFSPRGPHRLVLVTCAPPYDAARGGYQRLAIVTADPVGAPTRRGA